MSAATFRKPVNIQECRSQETEVGIAGVPVILQSASRLLEFQRFLGDHSEEDPPVPIPNTEVKLLSPDGTARATAWESRKSPGLYP